MPAASSDSTEPVTEARSYWQATAPAAPALPKLAGDRDVDVAIVGGGYTGLAAAEWLADAGKDCLVLEARSIGWGASGRNGGSATPRYKKGWATLAGSYGAEATRALHRELFAGIDSIQKRIARFDIACDFRRSGQATAAHGPAALDSLRADLDWLRRETGDSTPQLLDRDATASLLGTAAYPGAYYDPRGAFLHPLAYLRGWAAALAAQGLAIHAETPVTAEREEAGGVILETPGGRVRARTVIIATNAYTPEFFPGRLARRIVPVASSLIVTAPLSGEARARVLPTGAILADTRRLLSYACPLPDGRIMIGGRGDLTGRREDPASYARLEGILARLFPALAGTRIDYRWRGMVAVTLDAMPHLGRLGERHLFGLGYGGRGVVLAHSLGRMLGRMAAGETIEAGPFGAAHLAVIPLHGWRRPIMQLTAGYWGLRDRIEERARG